MISENNQMRILCLTLLSDFIVSKFPNDVKSLIRVIDVGNFIVIKGKTNSSEVLDISNITTEFKKKHENLFGTFNLNTIDIIEYQCDPYFLETNIIDLCKI